MSYLILKLDYWKVLTHEQQFLGILRIQPIAVICYQVTGGTEQSERIMKLCDLPCQFLSDMVR